MQSNDIVKTYMVVTGRNDKKVYHDEETDTDVEEYTLNPTFTVKFPDDFVNSTNRRFITVMPPKIIFGDHKRHQFDNQYIMHCSFIYRDPYHEKACMPVNMGRRTKYKKYEYKANYDTFDITFTHNQPTSFTYWYFGEDHKNTTEDEIKANLRDMLLQEYEEDEADELVAKVQAHVDEWKAMNIQQGTYFTPQMEAIVPLFNCYGYGGTRVLLPGAPFHKEVRYLNVDIWSHAIALENIDVNEGIVSTADLGNTDQKEDKHYIYDRYFFGDDVFGNYGLVIGEYYKLLSNSEPWSYYAEFLLQY